MVTTKVLVVGEPGDRAALSELLAHRPFDVRMAGRRDLTATMAAWRPDVVLADVAVPGLDGRELVDALASPSEQPRIVLVSARASRVLEPLGVVCIAKPIDLSRLHSLLEGRRDLAA